MEFICPNVPFRHISDICFDPREEGPNQIPSIREASVGGNVGIGADKPSGSGTVRWYSCGGPSDWGIYINGSGRKPIFHMDARPLLN
jgi:hypothetical protein